MCVCVTRVFVGEQVCVCVIVCSCDWCVCVTGVCMCVCVCEVCVCVCVRCVSVNAQWWLTLGNSLIRGEGVSVALKAGS